MAGLNRTRLGYRLTLWVSVTRAAFGTAVATVMLSMSATRRVKSGVLLSAAVSVPVLIGVSRPGAPSRGWRRVARQLLA